MVESEGQGDTFRRDISVYWTVGQPITAHEFGVCTLAIFSLAIFSLAMFSLAIFSLAMNSDGSRLLSGPCDDTLWRRDIKLERGWVEQNEV